MKSMKRAIRKCHLERMKRRARRVYPWCARPERYANHLKMCSCSMCGNPRRYWRERTLQERRLLADLEAERCAEAGRVARADAVGGKR